MHGLFISVLLFVVVLVSWIASKLRQPTIDHRHYLEVELDSMVTGSSMAWRFIQGQFLDGVLFWNVRRPDDGWISPEFYASLGYSADEVADPGTWWLGVIHPEDLPAIQANYNAQLADPSLPYEQLCRFEAKDGSWLWFECKGFMVRDAAGRATRMLVAHNDVTVYKRAINRLETANRSLEQFAFTASHDLREPIRTIASYVEAAFDTLASAQAVRALMETEEFKEVRGEFDRSREVIDEAVARANTLISDLLRFAKAGQNLVMSTFSSGDLMLEVEESVRSSIADEELRFDFSMAGLDHQIFGDRSLLRIALSNLVRNAVKFRKPDGVLVVCLEVLVDRGMWSVSVVDNGIGIERRHFDRIFGVFQRLHSRDEYEGTGIGLALVQRICEAHGGTAQVESEGAGKGCKFTMTLPLESKPPISGWNLPIVVPS